MSSWDIGRGAYLVLLLIAVVVWFLAQNRQTLNKTLQQALVWVFLFIGLIAAVGLWDDIRSTVRPMQAVHGNGKIELPRAPNGHFYLTAQVNGTPIRFVVDTGATDIVISSDDAKAAGIDTRNLAFVGEAMTANGTVKTAPVRLKQVSVGPIDDHNVRAWVNGGQMDTSLMGMSYLQRFSKIEMTPRALVLTR
ncbi:aspartyl protease family protein [Thalassovita litoralis]|jgi:aspartyl protease family protein|uniref:Aspartyl protease family protein n=1 Tax=Thalassovita litoralis TaxID=1010611 RepID=A0A521FFZ4_9RHOB|nr:TIGR02281 family clan AA aspartic protease [Thalassovita litoralis]SMO95118.1 aspartyl protease family protein [Thalassovita litoralis]